MRTPEVMASRMPTSLNSEGSVTDFAAVDVALAAADAVVDARVLTMAAGSKGRARVPEHS